MLFPGTWKVTLLLSLYLTGKYRWHTFKIEKCKKILSVENFDQNCFLFFLMYCNACFLSKFLYDDEPEWYLKNSRCWINGFCLVYFSFFLFILFQFMNTKRFFRSNTWRSSTWRTNTWRTNTWRTNTWRTNTWRTNTWRTNKWRTNTWRTIKLPTHVLWRSSFIFLAKAIFSSLRNH